MDDLLLRSFASAVMCLPSRCLAMGIHVTIFLYTEETKEVFQEQNLEATEIISSKSEEEKSATCVRAPTLRNSVREISMTTRRGASVQVSSTRLLHLQEKGTL
jgi:hypothetical protein